MFIVSNSKSKFLLHFKYYTRPSSVLFLVGCGRRRSGGERLLPRCHCNSAQVEKLGLCFRAFAECCRPSRNWADQLGILSLPSGVSAEWLLPCARKVSFRRQTGASGRQVSPYKLLIEYLVANESQLTAIIRYQKNFGKTFFGQISGKKA